MFWGLIMEPQRRYTQKVKKAFHISKAALDISTSSEEPAQVMCGFQGRNYLLCTLRKPDMLQCSLDLNFDVGSEVSFAANGECHVHLTGYLQELYEEIEEEIDEEESTAVVAKKRNKSVENGPPLKKQKKKEQEDQEDEEDDSDLDVNDLLQKEIPSDDEDDSDAQIEEGEEVSEEEEEESDASVEEVEEESSLSEEETEEEEVTVKKKKSKEQKLNGVAKNEATPKKTKEQPKQKTAKEQKSEKKLGKEEKTPNKIEKGQKKVLQGNIIIEELREGNGPPAKPGKIVNVYYEGRLKNNKLFDSTTSGPGFKFRLGNGEVIKGWDVGLAGMKVGGKRRITCPPNMAYGPKGSPPAIPPNSTLVFEVELKKVN